MKLNRLASYVFIGSLFAVVMIWGYLPRVWLMQWPQLALLGLSAVGLLAWFVFSLDTLRVWMKLRSTQFGISLAITAVMSIVILASVNWLASTYNLKKDVTKNQFHTLSDQTAKIAGGLKEDVTIRVWATNVDQMGTNIDMRRFLENYKMAGHGKIKVEIKNPNEDRPGASADNVKRDKLIIIKSASGREARIDNFSDTKGEEQITNAIVQVLKGQKKTVCFLSGHGESGLNDTEAQGLSSLKASLESSAYVTKEVVLATSETMPSDCEALVIAGPKSEAVEREMKMIHDYFTAGGKGIALMGPGTPAGWRKFAADFGVTIRQDLVIDPRVQPPIAIATKNFAQDVEIVKGFGRLVILPETSSIEVGSSKTGETIKTFISSESYTFAKAGDLKSLKSIRPKASDLRPPLPVAVLIKRTISSGDAGKPAPNVVPTHLGAPKPGNPFGARPSAPPPSPPPPPPKGQGALERRHLRFSLENSALAQEPDDDGPPPAALPPGIPGVPPAPGPKDGPKTPKTEMDLIVISCQTFISNSFVNQVGNMDLFLNSVNSLLKDQDLIGIRPREVRQASLEISNENLRQVYATVLLVAGAFLVGGIMARRRKSAVE